MMTERNMRRVALAGMLFALFACDEPSQSVDEVIEKQPTKQEQMQALFESVLDGVQLIESNENIAKVTGEVDSSASYEVTYEGCVDGFIGGALCVREGRHIIDVVTPEIHIIRSVDQRYTFDGFASVVAYSLTGGLESHVGVTVDTDEHATHVEGTATGTLEVTGDITGPVAVSLTVGGGRNYTESAATPIVVSGTLTHGGEVFDVQGGFQRE